MTDNREQYPMRFSIDYQGTHNKLTTFFRIFTSIPIIILYCIFTKLTTLIMCPVLLMIVFKRKYPKWWFDFNLSLSQFSTRVFSYLFFLVDEYPSTDEQQKVHLELDYPNVKTDLHQYLPLIKWFLAIPHYVIFIFLIIASLFVSILAWFSILFTGKYPESLFNFQVGVFRWGLRIQAYAFLLITDKYPLFSLK